MMQTILFVLAIITSSGQLELSVMPVKSCPDVSTFASTMDEAKAKGEIKEWDANCITFPVTKKGQPV